MRLGKSAKILFYCNELGEAATYPKIAELAGLKSLSSIANHVKKLKKLNLLPADFMTKGGRRPKRVFVDRELFENTLKDLLNAQTTQQVKDGVELLLYELEGARTT